MARAAHPSAAPGGPPILALAIAAAAVSIVLTGIGFWLSYQHLAELAMDHGLAGARAWAWPGAVDLFIIVGEILTLRAALARRVDWWAIALTVLGSAGSIALNIAAVGPDGSPLDYVTAAVPPVAALLAFGAIMRQLHDLLAARADTVTDAPAAVTAPVNGPSALPTLLVVPAPRPAADEQPATPPMPEQPPAVSAPVTPVDHAAPAVDPLADDPSARVVADLYAALGREPVTAEIRDALRARGYAHADGTCREARKRARVALPELAAYPTRLATVSA